MIQHSPIPEAQAVGAGCHSCGVSEMTSEMALIVIAGFYSDLTNTLLAVGQHLAGAFDPEAMQKTSGRHDKNSRKTAVKVSG